MSWRWGGERDGASTSAPVIRARSPREYDWSRSSFLQLNRRWRKRDDGDFGGQPSLEQLHLTRSPPTSLLSAQRWRSCSQQPRPASAPALRILPLPPNVNQHFPLKVNLMDGGRQTRRRHDISALHCPMSECAVLSQLESFFSAFPVLFSRVQRRAFASSSSTLLPPRPQPPDAQYRSRTEFERDDGCDFLRFLFSSLTTLFPHTSIRVCSCRGLSFAMYNSLSVSSGSVAPTGTAYKAQLSLIAFRCCAALRRNYYRATRPSTLSFLSRQRYHSNGDEDAQRLGGINIASEKD
jgi:hypothetical protein